MPALVMTPSLAVITPIDLILASSAILKSSMAEKATTLSMPKVEKISSGVTPAETLSLVVMATIPSMAAPEQIP